MTVPACCNNINKDNNIIRPDSLSFDQILADLKADVLNRPDGDGWTDFLESSTGQVIMRWMAGMGTYLRYSLDSSRLENSLEFARHRRSIVEHAFNRGLALDPVQTATIIVTLKAVTDTNITIGQRIGSFKKYSVYSLESKMINNGTTGTVRCCVGYKEIFTQPVSGLKNFVKLQFLTKYKFISKELESFLVDSSPVTLRSDVNYLSNIGHDFCLRRVVENEVMIYTGNNVIGWKNETASNISYTCVSYDEDVIDDMLSTITMSLLTINKPFTSFIAEKSPEFGMTDRELKRAAIYYPADGRIITDVDYEAVVLKHYGGKFLDVYAYNSDPNEEIYLIADTTYISGDLDGLKNVIDSKRGLGIQIFYHVKQRSDGKTFQPGFKVKTADFTSDNVFLIQQYLISKHYTITRENTTVTNTDLAIELTKACCFEVYPSGSQSINMSLGEFFNNIDYNITVI